MKKILFLILAVTCFVSVMAQSNKVAILDIVDRESQIEYNTKLMLRSYITEAVTKTPGYEAYEYTDLGDDIDEYEFRRTGNLKAEDIRKIGQKAGVQKILVIEASKIKSNKLFITAKLLNTATAQMEITANITTKAKMDPMQKGIKELATQVLANRSGNELPKLVYNPSSIRRIYHKKAYSYGDLNMSYKEVLAFVYERCPEIYPTMKKGIDLKITGWVFGGITGMWVLPLYVPCLTEGYKNCNKAIEYFNQHNAGK